MHKFVVVVAIVLVASATIAAQPKVAVLDTMIDAKMDPSVIVPVTEKIIERFVVSGRYKVLDRSNVQQVLSEREFQLSGLVSDAEITQAGRFLGADFVVVPRVQLLADTYFLTCKMINVETGVIANQASTEGEGKLSVLLGMAERVGSMMSGTATASGSQAATTTQAGAGSAGPDANRIGFRLYGGIGGGAPTMAYTGWNDIEYLTGGFELYALTSLWKSFILTGGVSYMSDLADVGLSKTTFSVGTGLAIPIGILMPWASLNFGVPFLDWYDLDEPFVGAEFSLDAGMDLRLGSLLIGLRYQVAYAAFSDDYDDFLYVSGSSIWLMTGFRF